MKAVQTRTVMLLGRRPSVNWEEVRDGLRPDGTLVVLSLGYPVTAGQRTVLLEAQQLAADAEAWFDGLLVTSIQEMLAAVRPEDEVLVAARGRERKQLSAALAEEAARG